jgi:hypothetical protein
VPHDRREASAHSTDDATLEATVEMTTTSRAGRAGEGHPVPGSGDE